MADFLTRVAERALGLTPLAQPKVLPRFADGSGVKDLPGEAESRYEEPVPLVDELLSRRTDPAPPAADNAARGTRPKEGGSRLRKLLARPRPPGTSQATRPEKREAGRL